MAIEHSLKNGRGLIFVGGAPRSGTTLMQRVLSTHDDVFAGPEFDFIPSIVGLRNGMLRSIQSGRINALVDEETLDKAVRTFICTMFEERLTKSGKSFFCEKTPRNATVVPELEKIFPDARHIIMVRDPRDIVNSMRTVREKFLSKGEKPPRFTRSIAASVQIINEYYRPSLIAAEKSDKILLVYYEDFVNNPEREIRRVCDHTGLTYQSDMLNIENIVLAGAGVGGEHFYTPESLRQPIQASGVVSTKFLLSAEDVALVERFTVEIAALDRYDLQPQSPTLLEKLKWYASVLRKRMPFREQLKRK
ncbi:sulfotransferase [Gymnodinialimonas sp. 57CJ19]|uniref:sulfotransferase family protein n=1 Tax=Gymnodinialimonas sp. 57CJ19 TaxID=3138498 RepID=UPI0031342C77